MILKISLKPQHKFFFGGEGSFNDPSSQDRRATYILHSRNYPQQTGVLGLIRNQLLLQNDLLWDNTAQITDKTKAKTLIGAHGFQVGYQGTYGVIQRISSIELEDASGQQWIAAPRDDVKMKTKKAGVEYEHTMTYTEQSGRFLLKDFVEKSGLYAQVRRADQQTKSLDGFFVPIEQVGITKAAKPWGNSVSDKDDDAGYYYQTFLSFNHDPKVMETPIQRYSFYLELADEHHDEDIHYAWAGLDKAAALPYTLQDALVEFGGERSSFFMEVTTTDLADFPTPTTSYLNTSMEAGLNTRRLVCLSPCAVDVAQLRPLSQLIVSESLSFRFFRSKVTQTTDYQSLHQDATATSSASPIESHLYELLDRGSVIYFDPAQEPAITKLFNREDFKIIGYNQYSIL